MSITFTRSKYVCNFCWPGALILTVAGQSFGVCVHTWGIRLMLGCIHVCIHFDKEAKS